MSSLGGNALLIFFKWGQEKQPPVFQGLIYPHVVDTSGRADDDGLGTAIHAPWTNGIR